MKTTVPNCAKTIFLIVLIVTPAAVGNALSAQKQVAGWIEYAVIFPGKLKIKAKLDTGARHSSLNATHIDEFERDGQKWVGFDVTNWQDRTVRIEARVIRTAKIKQLGKESAIRDVIQLGICVGNVYKEVEVNLEDRSKFNYQLLIGRSFLKESLLVDAATTFTVEPDCQEAAQP